MLFHRWDQDLERALPELQRVVLGHRSIRILTLGGRIAFGLPEHPDLAGKVLALYRPMKARAKIIVWIYQLMVKLRFRFAFKKTQGSGQGEIPWLKNHQKLGFLGCNPAHGLRCVILGSGDDGEITVTKLAIGKTLEPVVQEGQHLKTLCSRYRGVPEILNFQQGDRWVAYQTRFFAQQGPRCLTDPAVLELLNEWLIDEHSPVKAIGWVEPLFLSLPMRLQSELGELRIQKAMIHGDFAPWNLRNDEGGVVAIDWEWMNEDGIGGLDLIHGLIAEARLVRGFAAMSLLHYLEEQARKPHVQTYLSQCGWKRLELWMGFGLAYSSARLGLDVAQELEVLENRLAKTQSN